MSYIVPQARVYQEFSQLPSVLVDNLRTIIIGPNYELLRYSEALEKASGYLGAYDYETDTSYSWPEKTAGSIVDQNYTKLYIDDAYLRYFYKSTSEATIKAPYYDTSVSLWSSAQKNMVRAANINWTDGNSCTRYSGLNSRNVTIGDKVKITGTVDATVYTLWSEVKGFVAEKTDGTVGDAEEDTNNCSSQFESSSSSSMHYETSVVSGGTYDTDVDTLSVSASIEDHIYEDGVIEDTYTLTCTSGGTYSNAIFKLVSASGTDDESGITLAGVLGDSESIGNKNILVSFSGTGTFTTSQYWTFTVRFESTDTTVYSSGTYTGGYDDTYVITVTKGGSFDGTTAPEITVSTTKGLDVSGPHEVTDDTEITIGTKGVKVMFSGYGAGAGLYFGDKYYISVTAPSAGCIKTLILNDNLPSELLGDASSQPLLNIKLYMSKNIQVTANRIGHAPSVNFSQTNSLFTVKSGITVTDSTIYDADGDLVDLYVEAGSMYLEYRALLVSGANTVNSLQYSTEVTDELGPVTSDNPLAYGVYKALQNSSGVSVYYASVSADTVVGYEAVLDNLTNRNDIYTIVPLTHNSAVQAAVKSHVDAMSTANQGRWRAGIFCYSPALSGAVVDTNDSGTTLLATVGDDPVEGGTNTLVTASDVDFISSGVSVGDTVRLVYVNDGFGNYTYTEKTIETVRSSTELVLSSGLSSPVSVASKIEVWHSYSASELAGLIASASTAWSSRRILNVWPDEVVDTSGNTVEGYYLCAAIGGLTSKTVPQRSLTNIEISGFSSVAPSTIDMFTLSQLNQIAEGGTLILIQDTASSDIYCRHSLTTDYQNGLNYREWSVTKNVDSMSYVVLDFLSPYIGKYNITPDFLAQLSVELRAVIGYLKTTSTNSVVGPQLVDGDITKLEQNPVLLDKVDITLDFDLPYPFNNADATIQI